MKLIKFTMKLIKFTLLIIILSLYSEISFAVNYQLPPNNTYVLDLAHKLSNDELINLNEKINNIKNNSKNEFGVLLLQTLNGYSVEDVAYETFNHWGIGKKSLDNGILIVIAVSERKTRIETGKGVGELTDLQCNDILSKTLRPFLKKGDYFGGLNATIDAASSAIDSRKNVQPAVSTNSNSEDTYITIAEILATIFGLGLVGFIWRAIYLSKKEEEKALYDLQKEQDERNRIFRNEKLKYSTSSTKNHSTKTAIAIGVGAAAAVGGTAIAISIDEDRKRREKREQERRDEEARANRRREEESSYSSSSSYDSGSSWGGGDSGGGFSGGDSGGGGSSSDF